MIQEAFISGQIGQAIYLENNRYFVLSLEDLQKPKECHPMDVSTFFGLGAEVKSLSNEQLSLDRLRSKLVADQEAYYALSLIISGMDRILSDDSRTSAIMRAESLIKKASTHHFVKARLLSRPCPAEADIETALDIAINSDASSVGILYQTALDWDAAIGSVYETWLMAATDYYRSSQEQSESEAILTDLGVFADMAGALAANNLKSLSSIVVTYGQRPEVTRDLSQGVFILNDLRTRLAKTWFAQASEPKKGRRVAVDLDEAADAKDPVHEMLAGFRNRKENPRSKEFRADEAKEKVDHQIEAISKLILQGNISRADRYLQDLINFHIEHSEREHLGMSLCSLAKVAIDVNSLELAEKLVDYALMLGIDDVVIPCTQAQLLKTRGDFDQALVVYEDTMERFPNDEVALGGYGEVLKSMGDFDKALAVYKETMERFPNNEVVRNGYAEVLKSMGDFDKALAVYEEAMERFPNNEVARNGYAEVLKSRGDFDKALAVYKETIERFPNDEVARNGYAEVLKSMGDFDKALAVYKETMARFKGDRVTRSGYAGVLMLMNRFEEARSFLLKTDPRSKDDWIDYHIIAMSYLKEGDLDEAIRRLTYGLDNVPWRAENRYFANALAVAKIRKREFAEVPKILLTNVTDIDFLQRQTRLALVAHSHAALGMKDEAEKIFSELEGATNPRVIDLKEAIARRYRLGRQSHIILSEADARTLDSRIHEQEFLLAA